MGVIVMMGRKNANRSQGHHVPEITEFLTARGM